MSHCMHQSIEAHLMCIMGWGFLLVWALLPQLGQAAMGTPCSLLDMLRPTGISREGLASKKPNGFRKKPTCSAGMTGQSSILGMWVTPKECQITQSASTRFLSCSMHSCVTGHIHKRSTCLALLLYTVSLQFYWVTAAMHSVLHNTNLHTKQTKD